MQSLKINLNSILPPVILAVSLFVSYVLVAQALSKDDIVFPVPELGNCASENDCRTYCDNPKNITACVAFAEKYNLMSQEEVEQARKFARVGVGPGGCTTKDACESYCDDVRHIEECVAFAEKNDLMPPEELEEARKVQAALAGGATLPGGCTSKQSCDNYCNDSSHIEECITFAEAAGFIPPDELEEAKKVLAAVKRGAKPPPCRGKKDCDVYCSEPNNFEQCITFAEAAGFVSAEEAAMARKTGGKGPGNCRGREECDTFCQDEGNFEACLAFAEEHGLISKDELEMARKTGGKGPGNCRGREECDAFCKNPANEETCFNFAKEHDMIPEADLRRMEEGRQQMMQGFNQAPPEVMECLVGALGSEAIEKLKAGTAMPSRNIGDKMGECFKQMGPPSGPGGEGGPPGGPPAGFGGGGAPGAEFSGPGGCRTPEECMSYCQSNPEACQGPMPGAGGEGGFGPPTGPGAPRGLPPSGEFPPPPEGYAPPAGSGSGGERLSPDQYRQQYEQQYQQQYQDQYQQQYQEQYQQQMQQYQQQYPSGGTYPSTEGGGSYPSPEGSYTPPPEGSYSPPPGGNLLQVFLSPFVRIFSN